MEAMLLALLLALPAPAQVRTAPVRLPTVPLFVPTALPLPALSAPVLPAAAAPVLPSARPSLPSLPVLGAAQPAAVPAAVSPFGAALSDFAASFTEAGRGPSALPAAAAAGRFFDGGAAAGAPAARASSLPRGFSRGTLRAADGAELAYGVRRPAAEAGPARVFVGGMTLPESFQTYFEAGPSARTDYVLSLRGLPPSRYAPTRDVYDADARDMARMVVRAAETAPGGKVELALHSYGTLVFQRLLQLKAEPEVARALAALKGQRVVMFAPTTHYGDSETVAGPEYAEMARQVRMFISWLDAGDAYVEQWRALARLNPALIPQVETLAMTWAAQRSAALAMAAKPAADLLKQHLSEPWAPELEGTRRRLLAETRAAAADPGWQEAAMRRANDTSKLQFGPEDAAALKAAGIRLDLVLSRADQLIPWASQRLMPALFGVSLPEAPPAAGTALSDASGQVRVLVLEGDHYLPLKDPAAAAAVLGR